MFLIQRFDVRTYVGSPFVDDAGIAARAARFIAEFPAEDGGAGFVALDDEFDVFLIGSLRLSVGEETLMGATVYISVGVYAP